MSGEVIELDTWKDRRTLEEVLLSAAYYRGRMDTLEQTPEREHSALGVLLEVWQLVGHGEARFVALQQDLARVIFGGKTSESEQEQ